MRNESEQSPETIEEQLKSFLKQAQASFVMPSASPAPEATPEVVDSEIGDRDPLQPIREFDSKPREIRDYLDRFVIRQDEAKKVLSVAICDHYNHVRACIDSLDVQTQEYAKHNVVLLGPSGVGKTYLMRCIARFIGVPFVKADATKFSETGYVGHDVDDLVRDLVKAADGDVELAQYGIIYLDEVDKIASQASAGKDVSGRGVQTTLLKLMEDTDVSLFSQTDIIGQMQAVMELQRGGGKEGGAPRTINTRHILFIVSGAFDKLAELVTKRVKSSQIGFGQADDPDKQTLDYLHEVETRDFIEYGFEPEFIGRLPVRVVCDALSSDDLEQIMLSSEGSVLKQYRQDFDGYGVQLVVAPEAVREVAEQAHRERTGARGLMTVLERVLRDFKFELPSAGIKALNVTRDVILNPSQQLSDLMEESTAIRTVVLEQDLANYATRFEAQSGLCIEFNKPTIQAIIAACFSEDLTVSGLFGKRFRDLEYGLSLISRNTGQTTFRISKAFVLNPGKALSAWVAKSFQEGNA